MSSGTDKGWYVTEFLGKTDQVDNVKFISWLCVLDFSWNCSYICFFHPLKFLKGSEQKTKTKNKEWSMYEIVHKNQEWSTWARSLDSTMLSTKDCNTFSLTITLHTVLVYWLSLYYNINLLFSETPCLLSIIAPEQFLSVLFFSFSFQFKDYMWILNVSRKFWYCCLNSSTSRLFFFFSLSLLDVMSFWVS